ncbi:hypothetical protein AMQ68_10560 [Chryseobacterium sp. ERMR1:04]|nr:hypothetical protein AMQ68_10560 [Chryseobacterium sp. ERMR1:04]
MTDLLKRKKQILIHNRKAGKLIPAFFCFFVFLFDWILSNPPLNRPFGTLSLKINYFKFY